MKLVRLFLLALAALIALPAHAQFNTPIVADTMDQGDWWYVDTTKNGSDEGVILTNGEGARTGDRVEIPVFMIFREPIEGLYIGGRLTTVVDCKTGTVDADMDLMLLTDMRMQTLDPPLPSPPPPSDSEVFRQFACNGDRTYAKHYGKGSLRAIAAEIMANQ